MVTDKQIKLREGRVLYVSGTAGSIFGKRGTAEIHKKIGN